eukprot:GHVS01011033.1.p1 GENE.GHVS01011033.1~~GHVS01011033.1.p1  ORF type:complete len:170 (-),score=21.79 GHVS01011033.1:53-562(-)
MEKMRYAGMTAAAHDCYDKVETRMVYDWVAADSRMDYYTDEKPLQAKVDASLSGEKGAQYDTWTHYLPGSDPERYEKNRKTMETEAQNKLAFAKQTVPKSQQVHKPQRKPTVSNSIDAESSEELSDEEMVSVVRESNRRRRIKLREEGINPEDAEAIEPMPVYTNFVLE